MRVEEDDLPKSIGDYAILRKLGEGGMGKVYLGEDVRLRRQVAIKTMKSELAMNPDDLERFIREARRPPSSMTTSSRSGPSGRRRMAAPTS